MESIKREQIKDLAKGKSYLCNDDKVAKVESIDGTGQFTARRQDGSWGYYTDGYWCGQESTEDFGKHLKYPFQLVQEGVTTKAEDLKPVVDIWKL